MTTGNRQLATELIGMPFHSGGHSRFIMKTNEVMKMFKTKDFYLVSTLVLFGYKIKKHINEANKSVFFFDEDEGLRALVQDYFYDKVRVSPHQFQTSIKTVKALMYN